MRCKPWAYRGYLLMRDDEGTVHIGLENGDWLSSGTTAAEARGVVDEWLDAK